MRLARSRRLERSRAQHGLWVRADTNNQIIVDFFFFVVVVGVVVVVVVCVRVRVKEKRKTSRSSDQDGFIIS